MQIRSDVHLGQGRLRQRPDHHPRPGRGARQFGCDEMTESPLHPVTGDGIADGLGHNETHPDIGVPFDAGRVQHQGGSSDPRTPLHRRAELFRVAHPVRLRQHGDSIRLFRRTGLRDPCDAGPTGWSGQHGSACGGGNRVCGCVADCSAGKCACSRDNSHIFSEVDCIAPVQGVRNGRAENSDLLTVRAACGQVKLSRPISMTRDLPDPIARGNSATRAV